MKNDFRSYSRLRFWVLGTAPIRIRIDGENVSGDRMSWKADAPPNLGGGWEEKIMEFGNFGSLVDNIYFEIAPEDSTATGTLLIDDIQLDRP